MKIEIEIPQEFEEHFMRDKFEDSLHRLSADAHLIAGNYEQETAIMLIKAFKESKTAYDVDKAVERLEELNKIEKSFAAEYNEDGRLDLMDIHDAKAEAYRNSRRIVKSGGIE